ncbi:MAG: hypothetical protein ACLPVY_26825 [Acidimicrobiia bacterium]
MTKGPLELAVQVAAILDELGIPYALGGSMASSLVGEPRSTVDVDIAIKLEREAGTALLEHANAEFYVPFEAAWTAIHDHSSFNLVDTAHGLKVDLFVLGEGLLDRRQIERRTNVAIPGIADRIWVTSPEDQVLRKLDWYRSTGHESDRQWRDTVGILRIQGDVMDREYLKETARQLSLEALLAVATDEANVA